jgi:hypothetical protein
VTPRPLTLAVLPELLLAVPTNEDTDVTELCMKLRSQTRLEPQSMLCRAGPESCCEIFVPESIAQPGSNVRTDAMVSAARARRAGLGDDMDGSG